MQDWKICASLQQQKIIIGVPSTFILQNQGTGIFMKRHMTEPEEKEKVQQKHMIRVGDASLTCVSG